MASDVIVTGLYRYPLKSCRAESLSRIWADTLGLAQDRRWMLIDAASGAMLTGREYPQLVRLVAHYEAGILSLYVAQQCLGQVAESAFTTAHAASVWGTDFSAWASGSAAALEDKLAQTLNLPALRLLFIGAEPMRRIKRLPDLPLAFADGYPVLLASEDSLAQLNQQVGRELSILRFRPNVVVRGALPFAEDTWLKIRIGDVVLRFTKPCERCVLTTVDPDTGALSADQQPLRSLAKFRKTPEGVLFGMNAVVETAGELRLDMPLEVLA